jgi:hypothetical protein
MSGFDCILGNPPWEMVQLDPAEYFSSIRPDIAALPTMAAKERAIKTLESTDPEVHRTFLEATRAVHAAQSFMHGSGRFPLTTRGRLNLAPLFAEAVRDSIADDGRAGLVVPTGIATDSFTQYFFRDLVDRASLASLFDFENAAPIFEGVHRSYKFSCLTLRAPAPDAKTAAQAPAAEFVFFAHKVEDLTDERRRFTLTRDEIALVNPNTKTCPIFRTKVDAELTKYIYRRVPVLVKEATDTTPEENPWNFSGQLMFMMNTASHLFRTREQLEKDGWKLRGNVFERGTEKYLPLYEAKMVHHYDHRWATYDGLDTRDMTDAERADPSAVAMPRYWVPSAELRSRLGEAAAPAWMIAYRWIARSTDERTFISSATCPAGFGNSAPVVRLLGVDSVTASLWPAVGASFALDYCARQKLGGANMTFGTATQLPVISPSMIVDAGVGCQIRHIFVRGILELSAIADDMSPFSSDLWPEGDGAVFRYDPERRFEIRCELDAAFFHLYLGTADEWRAKASPELLKALPTPRDAVAYIMETFPIVKKKDIAAHGVYRTKERIIALYDQLQLCLATNTPFVSALTPPPGPPTNADGSFAALPAWAPNTPRPANYPAHLHPPITHREGTN